jgi:pimeloyl-ACP methyl ester carboxylesterase
MWDPVRGSAPAFETPGWIAPLSHESLSDYAARLAATIPRNGPVVLGGASLGGMLALEMARHLRPIRVLLLSSCRTPVAIRPSLSRLGRAVGPWKRVPVKEAFAAGSVLARLLGASTGEAGKSVRAMFADTSPEFLRWGIEAVLSWPGCVDPGAPVRHLHGSRDLLIPARRVKADVLVPGAGHIPSLTHPEAVSRFLRESVP